ncbi:hypothetical protein [Aureimonas leprariae]|uniref:Uncharacterized protein n=1 Tax=Plantimonas leprariae TaxID=2615207 RepID=A0A7V7PKP1_9HYPH|nr:hypothetical protein [Aureimonas leprariae]KAB0676408.1 hypothetical protein F6X38_21160 [Aureimonas leprariae]
MSKFETLEAFEDGLITELEALEQSGVDTIDALYERVAVERIDSVAASMRRASASALALHS